MPPALALQRMLAGTGVRIQMTGPASAALVSTTSGDNTSATVDGAIALDTIDVSGNAVSGAGFQGTPDWVYETPSSVSVISREAIKNDPARDTRNLVAKAPGVYGGEGNGSFPSVSPNIRGMQDSGRIVVSIDGARQNAQRGFGIGSSGYQSNSGQAFVDSAFVREVDINKNPEAKAGSAASLGGGVDFRTIGADDLIAPGAIWGGEANITKGTNEYNFRGSALAATRIGEALSLTMGLSKLDLGEYLPGQNGGETASSGSFKGREAWSSLLKLEGKFGDVKTTVSWMHQDNAFAFALAAYENNVHVINDSATATLEWKPDNELIDVKSRIWMSNTDANEIRPARPSHVETEIDSGFLSFGFVLENTSRFDTAAGALKFNYGVEAFRDKGTSSASSTSIDANPIWESSFTSFAPPGQRDVASAFLNGELKPANWVTLSGGIRHDWSRLRGTPTYHNRVSTGGGSRIVGNSTNRLQYLIQYSPVQYDRAHSICTTGAYNGVTYNAAVQASQCNALNNVWPNTFGEIIGGRWYDQGVTYYEPIVITEPEYTLDIDRTDSAWLPSATLEFKPVEWFRPFVSYSHSFRPPSILEAFFAGGAAQDGLGITYAPNVSLKPETARTWEIGANISQSRLLRDDDSFRLKAVAFHREVNDYIVLGSIYTEEATNKTFTSFVNMDGATTMRGVEIEGNYDMRFAWIGAAATWLETDWPQRTEVFSNGTTTTDGQVIAVPGTVPPEFKLTVDGGVRLLDERLSIGARYNYVTPTQVNRVDLNLGGDLVMFQSTKAYSTIDIYGSLAFTEQAMFRFAVNNVTDINYIPATAAYNAPGRTVTMGMHFKF
jgi:hemoglobin/transferrin/lactoferrin receptor protein